MDVMGFLLAIDPGVRGCGIAAGADSRILAAGYVIGEKETRIVRAPAWLAMADAVVRWVEDLSMGERFFREADLAIELPQVYRGSHQAADKSKVNPNDLIDLAAVVGAVTASLRRPTRVYLPAEWKGQVPKEIVHERARAKLSMEELLFIKDGAPRASLAHNMWDAVSIFLKHVGRM